MKRENIFWGVLLIIAAIALILGKLNLFVNVNAFSIILTILFVGMIIKSIIHFNIVGILFPLAFISIIYDKQLGITAITPWTVLFAALLLSIGFSLIFHKNYFYHIEHHRHNEKTISIEDADHIKVDTSFGHTIKYINTDDFIQADLSSAFGGMDVYFDKAKLHQNNGIVNLEISFGGANLYIPKSWTVINKAEVSFGDIEEKNISEKSSENVLTLYGSVSFGNVTIIYI